MTVAGAQVNERCRALALVITQKASKELLKDDWSADRIAALAALLDGCSNDFIGSDEQED